MENQEKLEDLCGGANKAYRLLQLWYQVKDNHIETMFSQRNNTLERKFINRAINEGYSTEAINFFLDNF